MSRNLAAFYDAYIACLNARDWAGLDAFVAGAVVHNGRPFGLDGYRGMLEQNYSEIPDLSFHAETVVAGDSQIAARLRFDCSPVGRFLDLPINGRRIIFFEHAFYDIVGGLIAEVFSVIDKAGIERQLRR